MSDVDRKPSWTRYATFWFVCILLAFVVYRFTLGEGGNLRPFGEDDSATSPDSISRLTEPSFSSSQMNIIDKESRALAVVQLENFNSQAKSVIQALDILDAQMLKWQTEIEPLLDNEEGKWISGNKTFVPVFRKYFEDEKLFTSVQAQAIRSKVTELLAPVTAAMRDPSELYIPSAELSKQLNQEHAQANDAARRYQTAISKIKALIVSSRKSGTQGDETLQEAITLLEANVLAHQAVLIAAEQEKAQEEIARQLAEVESDKLRRIADAKKREAEAEAELAEQEADKKVRAIEIEKERKLASDPEIQKKYPSFLLKGRFILGQYRKHDGLSFHMSYSKLSTCCITKDLKLFVQYMLNMPVRKIKCNNRELYVYFNYNDRGPAPFAYPKSDSDWRMWQGLLEEFNKLAPYWIEMGLLEP